jgi:hypothetical protein
MRPTQMRNNPDMSIATLLLTHISNMLLITHCATNWMLFYRWPRRVLAKLRTQPTSLALRGRPTPATSHIPTLTFTFTLILNSAILVDQVRVFTYNETVIK